MGDNEEKMVRSEQWRRSRFCARFLQDIKAGIGKSDSAGRADICCEEADSWRYFQAWAETSWTNSLCTTFALMTCYFLNLEGLLFFLTVDAQKPQMAITLVYIV